MTSTFYGKIFLIIQFDGIWNEEWPDVFAILRSKGRILSSSDVLFYNSEHSVTREIIGGASSVPASMDEFVIGPINGFGDGEIEGRILRASGFNNFWFFEIYLDKINREIDQIEFLLFNYGAQDDCIHTEMDMTNVKVFVSPFYRYSASDFFELLKNGSKFIKAHLGKVYENDKCSIRDSISIGSLRRQSDQKWIYTTSEIEIPNLLEYLELGMKETNVN